MESKSKTLLAGAFLASSLIVGGSLSTNASNALSFNTLGSGAELRSELLGSSSDVQFNLEAKCGEKEKTEPQKEAKTKEAKCGEGKCGEKQKEAKAKSKKAKAQETKKEAKSKEAKCGEGKCGN